MKKIVLYLSLVSTLAVLNTVAMERENPENPANLSLAPIPLEDDRVERGVLSPHQRLLLPRREQGQIGDNAWQALGGGNEDLAAILLGSIQGYPGQIVEILHVDPNSFRLNVDRVAQGNLYKY